MELPHLGTHCAESTCNKLDFLPFTCNLCQKEFCVDHHKYTAHNCTESYRADAQVPICPLCDQPVPSKRGEPPDLAVNEHMENNCKNKKKKIYTNKCSADGCKTKEMIPVLCESCRQNYCLRHRHPSDHDCKGPTSAKEQALMAALARSKTSKSSSSSNNNSRSQSSSSSSGSNQQSARRVLSPAFNPVQPTGHVRSEHAAKVSTLQGSMNHSLQRNHHQDRLNY
ncbi:AN1-type zinc finger protein 2A-like isoform X2 [Portunus trituberculatus]|uniref:AN1-type zinc finger protein 2A-like isoform X2 n=1 Tax=Portunus trituberculatus TaxID=210409 RepID=UPI001E1D1A7D|nr:AN1-type zinc finger protein 2A-like isoform X2 [Portunus trituberculatus]